MADSDCHINAYSDDDALIDCSDRFRAVTCADTCGRGVQSGSCSDAAVPVEVTQANGSLRDETIGSGNGGRRSEKRKST